MDSRDTPKSIGDEEAFATLLLAAKDDGEFRRHVLSILSLESFHRRSLLNTLLSEMRMQHAPDNLVRVMEHLLDDAVAARALAFLEDDGR